MKNINLKFIALILIAAGSNFVGANVFADNSMMNSKNRYHNSMDDSKTMEDSDTMKYSSSMTDLSTPTEYNRSKPGLNTTTDYNKSKTDINSPHYNRSMTDSNSVMVGGAAMLPSKNIVENASNSKDHTTLVSAVKAAGLVDTLSGRGPFTVFAPTNTAFSKLPSGTVENLLKPENKSKLAKVLTFHVVSGKMNARDLLNKLNSSGGKIELKTVQGDNLTLKLDNGAINVMDSQGNVSKVTIPDVNHSNGVTHVVDTVLMPKL